MFPNSPYQTRMAGFSPLASVDQITLDAIPIAIAIFEESGDILRMNRNAASLLSFPPSGSGSKTLPPFLEADGSAEKFMAAVVQGQPIYDLDLTMERSDGKLLTLVLDLEPAAAQGIDWSGMIACLRDVTEAKFSGEASQAQQRDLEDFFENGAVALHLVSADGTILRANQAELQFLGYDADEYIGQPIGRFHADRIVIEDILHRLSDGEYLHRYPARLRAKDGSIKHVQITSNAKFGEAGFENTRCFTVDVTDEVEASIAARQTEQKARDILEALPAAVYTTDASGRITFFNEAAVKLSGRRPEIGSDQWCVTWRLFETDGTPLPHDRCPMAISLREGRSVRGVQAIAERPDGTRVPFMPYPTPLFDADGKVIGGINMLVDLSAVEQAEHEQRLLIDELNHRVKNTLSTVQSIAVQTMRSTPEPAPFVANFQGRILALAKAHDLLTRRRWTGVSLGELINEEIVAPLGPDGGRMTLEGSEITLTPRVGLTLGMVFHELLTNALQHGAFSRAEGSVLLNWTVLDGIDEVARLRIRWEEHGGPPATPPVRMGFGSRLIDRSVRNDLDGSVEASYLQSGFRCALEFPLP